MRCSCGCGARFYWAEELYLWYGVQIVQWMVLARLAGAWEPES